MATKKNNNKNTKEDQEEKQEETDGQQEDGQQKDDKKKRLDKKFSKLSDYKSKLSQDDTNYKEQEWINMSYAFKNTTKLPGIPVGHTIMNYGKSDVGKTTMLLEAAKYAQEKGTLPIFIITENKFSWERAETIGVDKEKSIVHTGVETIEEGANYMNDYLNDQKKGELPFDIIFLWDSMGSTPSRAEKEANEYDEKNAMMKTARVIKEKFTRHICTKVSATRKEDYPYNATFFVVNHAYQTPPRPPATIGSLEPYGGDGLYLASTLVFRMGGVQGRASKVSATKDKTTVSFALKTPLKVEKDHIKNVTGEGKIVCTDHGFIEDDKEAIDEYKKQTKDGWDLQFDKYWDQLQAEND